MAKETTLEGVFTEAGESQAVGISGRANILISGGQGAVHVEKSFDGINFYPVSPNPIYVSENTPLNGVMEEIENQVQYRFNCVEHGGGEITYRIGKSFPIK